MISAVQRGDPARSKSDANVYSAHLTNGTKRRVVEAGWDVRKASLRSFPPPTPSVAFL